MIISSLVHDPCRKITITPKTIKVLSDGTEIITYYWGGAEVAETIENERSVFVGLGIGFIGNVKISTIKS